MAKKADTKKEVQEEVKFCKNCGKKLVGDQVCDCVKESPKTENGNFDFMATLVSIKDDTIKSIKTPVEVIEDLTSKQDMPKTYMLLTILSLAFGIFTIGIVKGFAKLFGAAQSQLDIPYFKILICFAIVYAFILVAYAVVILLVPSIFKNKKIDFKQALTLSSAAHIPVILISVICALLAVIGIRLDFVFVIFAVANSVVTYNFVHAYAKYTSIESDKFGYSIGTLVVLGGLLAGIASYITINLFFDDAAKMVVDGYSKTISTVNGFSNQFDDLEELDDLDF